MLNSPLWQCPICLFDGKEPTSSCKRCGSNMLLLVKIKVEAQASILRVEEARARFLHAPLSENIPIKKSASFLKRIRDLVKT